MKIINHTKHIDNLLKEIWIQQRSKWKFIKKDSMKYESSPAADLSCVCVAMLVNTFSSFVMYVYLYKVFG